MRRAIDYDAAASKNTEAHKVIKAMRIYLGLSQEEVAKKAGISHLVYYRYEKEAGYILRGGFSEVCMILKILHLNPRKFYQGQYVLNETGYKAVATSNPVISGISISKRKRESLKSRYLKA